jgi:hypothetical protein
VRITDTQETKRINISFLDHSVNSPKDAPGGETGMLPLGVALCSLTPKATEFICDLFRIGGRYV